MRSVRVSPRPVLRQGPLAFIAILSCALSLWLTVRFCGRLCPGETAIELLAIGILWESAKLVFGTYGMHTLTRGSGTQRLQSLCLVLVSLVLAAGSIAASCGFLLQTDTKNQERTLASSAAYTRTQAELAAIDQQIQVLASAASHDIDQNFRTRGLRSLDGLTKLRAERHRVAVSLGHLETTPSRLGGNDFFTNIGALFPGEAVHNTDRLRVVAQGVLAVMLELISLIALSMLRISF